MDGQTEAMDITLHASEVDIYSPVLCIAHSWSIAI